MAQQIFQQYLKGIRQAGEVAQAAFGGGGQGEIVIVGAVNVKRAAGIQGIIANGGHGQSPLAKLVTLRPPKFFAAAQLLWNCSVLRRRAARSAGGATKSHAAVESN